MPNLIPGSADWRHDVEAEEAPCREPGIRKSTYASAPICARRNGQLAASSVITETEQSHYGALMRLGERAFGFEEKALCVSHRHNRLRLDPTHAFVSPSSAPPSKHTHTLINKFTVF